MAKEQILILEDDTVLADGLKLNLELEGFEGITANSISKARELMRTKQVQLLLFDINLPDGEGIAFARECQRNQKIPLIFLTARDMDEDMIQGFDAGADDYVTKPFNIYVLIQRIRAVLRRYGREETQKKIQVGNLDIDIEGYSVKKSGKPLTLTPTEYKLLFKFCANPGMVLTREILLEELWDKDGNFVDEHTLTINVSRLRSKISDKQYSYIRTVYGTGYQWIGERNE